ncbi:hypothetical protein KUTeg_005522, partial [Tegillarca granosa]
MHYVNHQIKPTTKKMNQSDVQGGWYYRKTLKGNIIFWKPIFFDGASNRGGNTTETSSKHCDSCSSIGSTGSGSDILFKSANSGQKKSRGNDNNSDRVLRDTSNIRKNQCKSNGKQSKRKREQKAKHQKQTEIGKKELSKYNFSDFDDYSLLVSGSPVVGSGAMETSTPCAKRTRSADENQISNNISGIELMESPLTNCQNDFSAQSTNLSPFNKLGLSSIDSSPVLVIDKSSSSSESCHSNKSKNLQNTCNFDSPANSLHRVDEFQDSSLAGKSKNESDEQLHSDCYVQLEKLRESMLKMRVSKRRASHSEQKKVFNGSDCLFSSIDSEKSTNSRYYSAESESENEEEDESEDSSDEEYNNDTETRNIDLNESIFEMLTPSKSSVSEVPLSPRSKVLQACQKPAIASFKECITASMMKKCVKIGDGVYGEVFLTQNRNKSVALKIIPIEGSFTVNDEAQKTFAEILPEIVISRYHMNCKILRITVIKGIKSGQLDMFDDNQLFIMFEFDNGGKALESFEFSNFFEAKSVFVQVAFSLAVAEEALEFEHRDLHIGNVLVKKSTHKSTNYRLLGTDYKIENHGVEACIIDFTLSRLRKDGCTVFTDLSTDETLFQGSGDYQFDIYRKMQEENGNQWEPFHARTNVFWLHYLADKLLRAKRYTKNSGECQALLREFRLFHKEILDYNSVCEL